MLVECNKIRRHYLVVVSKIGSFLFTSVTRAAVSLSFFSITLHVANNTSRFRLYQSYASFLLLLPWTAQLFFTTHSQSDMHRIPTSVRGVRWNIWGTMKSLLPVLPTKVPLSVCLLFFVFSLSSRMEADLSCCFMSLYCINITCEVYSLHSLLHGQQWHDEYLMEFLKHL